ncbi:S1 RNA-binding domain-containing protein [Myxococcota bacterium]|nr:S1 RNA-binding domain-containing protein [Myxococcota bacterium]MBU1536106.1 S1 RNA-binding domain-containing protein [Myxococcota bacterium]
MGETSIKAGTRQQLIVHSVSLKGAHLDAGTSDPADNILLPVSQFQGKDIKEGEVLSVFVFRDSDDLLVASLNRDIPEVGSIARMKVVDKAPFGAFLDWGLPKDLLLPKGEEQGSIEVGKSYLVGLYDDGKGRVCATMDLQRFLYPNFHLDVNEIVTGTVYKILPSVGVFVAIEDAYFGLIPKNEFFSRFSVGEVISARVIRVREDGKVDLSPRMPAHLQMSEDARAILGELRANPGHGLQLTQRSLPEEITATYGISKQAFKRALGSLLKSGLIEKREETFFLTRAGREKEPDGG